MRKASDARAAPPIQPLTPTPVKSRMAAGLPPVHRWWMLGVSQDFAFCNGKFYDSNFTVHFLPFPYARLRAPPPVRARTLHLHAPVASTSATLDEVGCDVAV
eukprot:6344851-Prymnesium_polylepis.1